MEKAMKKIKGLMTIITALVMVMMMSVSAFADSLTQDGAVNTALKDAGLTAEKVQGLEVELEKGKYEIEFMRKDNRTEFEYEISASDGKILEKSVDYVYSRTKSKKKIGAKAARKKAAKISGIKYKTVNKGTCKYTYKKKLGKYTVKFRSGGYKYEVDVLAATGKVIEFEKEAVRK